MNVTTPSGSGKNIPGSSGMPGSGGTGRSGVPEQSAALYKRSTSVLPTMSHEKDLRIIITLRSSAPDCQFCQLTSLEPVGVAFPVFVEDWCCDVFISYGDVLREGSQLSGNSTLSDVTLPCQYLQPHR